MTPPATVAPPLSGRFFGALSYAAIEHVQQRRKGSNVPYIAHLLGVASIALEHGANEDEAIAALLHDVVEDQGGKAAADAVRSLFGDEVARIVLACSDTDATPKPPWQERKRRYIEHVKTADRSVSLVSASDKLYNALAIVRDHRQVGPDVWNRFTAGRDQILWYYESLVDAFQANAAAPAALLGELDRAVAAMRSLG
jgi:GTP pyrophosphokinase